MRQQVLYFAEFVIDVLNKYSTLFKTVFILLQHFPFTSLQYQTNGKNCLRNGYTMGCPPVRGDNPQALASGLSYVHVDKHGITILYHLHKCRPCTSQDISCKSW